MSDRPYDDAPAPRHAARPGHARREAPAPERPVEPRPGPRRPVDPRYAGARRADEEAFDDDLVDADALDGGEHDYGDDDDDYGYYDDDDYDARGYGDADDYVTVRRGGGGGGRRLLTVLGVAVLALLVVVAGAGIWISRQIDPPGGPGETVTIEIPQGSTTDGIGKLLAAEGIITSDFIWGWYIRINGGGPFQAGAYELRKDSAMGDVVAALEAGPAPRDERSFTIPEGLTIPETVARLADPEKGLGLEATVLQQLLDSGEIRSRYLPPEQTNLEGTLFPETYRVGETFDERSVLTMLVNQLDSTLAALQVESAQERFNLTPYEILIVASLIEEETKVDAERAQVARVIYNRLRTGTPLGIDATSRYEAELAGRSRDQLDFSSDSPYNTRRNAGLPPTPIASPGRASIEAALNPADGDWIYYVLQDAEGNHFFTASYDEFLAAKRRCADAGLGCG